VSDTPQSTQHAEGSGIAQAQSPGAVATVITNIFRGSTTEQRALRNRQAMLQLVRNFWVKGVLEQSLHGAAMIELGLEERADAVERPWDMVLQTSDQPNRPLPPGTKIVDVFDEMNQSLLILGEPGSGKTTMLLELARDTIACAEQDPMQPIPVVFNLSSWAEKRQPLAKWLVEELNTKYHIPKKIARPCIENDALLLLLDGLDEVRTDRRDACVAAINTFRQEHLVPIVVCSRIADYEALTAKLQLQCAILLQSLTSAQIDQYLAGAGPELQAVRDTLHYDHTLQELVHSPLLLSIIALAYRGLSVEEVQTLSTLQARRQHLFNTYIQSMFKRRGKEQPYTQEQTAHWLAWLAKQMSQHAQTVFLIERLQPSWLSVDVQQSLHATCVALVTLLSVGIPMGLAGELASKILTGGVVRQAFGLAIGTVFGLTALFASKRAFGSKERLAVGGAFGIAIGILIGPIYGIVKGLAFGGIVGGISGVTFGSIGNLLLNSGVSRETKRIEVVDALSWSWSRAALGLIIGAMIGLGLELVISTARGHSIPLLVNRVSSLFSGNKDFWLFFELIAVLTIVPITGILGGFTTYKVEQTAIPNQGIWQSLRNANLVGFSTLLLVALFIGGSGILAFGLRDGSTIGLCCGISIGVAVWMFFGGLSVLQHFILRFLLIIEKCIPHRYTHFLDYATDRIFLRKVGGGYIFVHRLLMEYFASLEDNHR
jgi:MFS family permease